VSVGTLGQPRAVSRHATQDAQSNQALFGTEKTASVHDHVLAELGVGGRGEAAPIVHRLDLASDDPPLAGRCNRAPSSGARPPGRAPSPAVPIKPGKEETWKSWAAETNGARKAEFDEMNERMGLTTHAAWLQENPDGSRLAVVVLDGPGASEFLGTLATSDHEFDRWFRTNVEDIHPMDFSAPPPPAPVRFL